MTNTDPAAGTVPPGPPKKLTPLQVLAHGLGLEADEKREAADELAKRLGYSHLPYHTPGHREEDREALIVELRIADAVAKQAIEAVRAANGYLTGLYVVPDILPEGKPRR